MKKNWDEISINVAENIKAALQVVHFETPDGGFYSHHIQVDAKFNDLINLIHTFPRFILTKEDEKLASFGNFQEIREAGEQKYLKVEQKITKVFEASISSMTSPFFVGGFSFDNQELSEGWERFGSAYFSMGDIQVRQHGKSVFLIFNRKEKGTHEDLIAYYKSMIKLPKRYSKSIQTNFTLTSSKESWRENIEKCTQSIDRGDIVKVVMARSVELQDEGITVLNLDIYNYLKSKYEKNYNFHLEPTKGNYFVGASPELLIGIKKGVITSVALAGTIQRGDDLLDDEELANKLISDSKERKEHKIVVDQIVNLLDRHCNSISYSQIPTIMKLKNVQHLMTPISGKLKERVTLFDLVSDLHPTPAVGGKPREPALEIIKDLEVSRGWYASPIGFVDSNLEGEFIVALRSALIRNGKIKLYAGAGIVKGSTAEKEWEETRLKFMAIEEAIRNI